MSDYDFAVTRDSTVPAERARALRRISTILAYFPQGLPEGANCFLHGLTLGWAVSPMIGQADADEVEALLPPRPDDVIIPIPYGPEDVDHPELATLTADEISDDLSFEFWMGIKRHLYAFEQQGTDMPERYVLAWLGFLHGQLEARGISQTEYDELRSMMPSVDDELILLLIAIP